MLALRLQKGNEKEVLKGFPWVYAGDMVESSELLFTEPGELAELYSAKGDYIGTGYYNHHSKLAFRLLTRDKKQPIDQAFFVQRFKKALERREKKITVPYYRLCHAESDGLPGLVIDRFGDTVVCQVATAGMERLQPVWMAALEEVIAPHAMVLRNDISSRTLEGLGQKVEVIKGEVPALTHVSENGAWYVADLINGQKTGWFYDQRESRAYMAKLSQGKSFLDVYCHSGGFGIVAAKQGAASVTFVDSSALALDLAMQAAALNGVEAQCTKLQGNAFEVMEALAKQGKRYEVVIADPPAFVKTKKDIASGMKGYEKVTKYAAALVAPGGLLYVASCSHHAQRHAFAKAVEQGIKKAGREGKLIATLGHAADHPVHPQLPQSEYLKAVVWRLEGEA